MAAGDAAWHDRAVTPPHASRLWPRRWPAPLWRGPPLVLQILLLLLGGLVVAQLVTLGLTLVLPPAPAAQRSLADVAAALNGVAGEATRPDRLERVVQAGPPDVEGPGWLTPDAPRRTLAGLLGVPAEAVRLAFYTPLPFAGTVPRKVTLLPNDGPSVRIARADGGRLILAQAPGPPPPAAPPPMPPRGGSMPSQIPPGAAGPPPRDGFPPGLGPGGPGGRGPGGAPGGVFGGREFGPPRGALIEIDPAGARPGTWLPGDGGAAVPPLLQGAPRAASGQTIMQGPPPRQDAPSAFDGRPGASGPPPLSFQPPVPRFETPPAPETLAPPRATAPRLALPPQTLPAAPPVATARVPAIAPTPLPPLLVAPAPPAAATFPQIAAAQPEPRAAEPAIPLAPRPRGLFGLAPAPYVEGDFVAALKLADGQWAVVQPAPEPFPNAWQRRVLLWFAFAFAIVAPVGWLFARALVRPLTGFAEAAEALGRDPAAMVGRLDGPAEVGRAARAFNLMQSRLKSFVDDRTAMVGAISHDLRTPLTRLRFRIEEVDDDAVRDGMIDEVTEMEAMIASVLAFIRDASTPGARERIDLRTLIEDVAEDAALVGGDVAVAPAPPGAVPVEVDPLGMRRLLANLVENAVKYGDRARVRLSVERGEAVAAVVDDGPGVPDDELERAFEPFYRAANARGSNKSGSGLGLAVCRSIARAHGGDVRLRRSPEGFVAELRVPLALAA